MNKRRIFLRILKVYFFVGLAWLLLAAAILLLPSANPEDSWDSEYLVEEGGVLSRVYNLNTFYPYADRTPDVGQVRRTWKSHLILDMKVEKTLAEAGDQYWLLLGARRDSFGFSFSGKRGLMPYHNISLSIPDKDAGASVSSPQYFTSRTANSELIDFGDGSFWLNKAEVVLMNWWRRRDWTGSWDHWDLATTPVRVRVDPDQQVVDVWAESLYWKRPDAPWNPPEIGALVRVNLSDDKPSFSFNSQSTSPSNLYLARLSLFAMIVPITYFFIGTTFVVMAASSIIVYATMQAVFFLATVVSTLLGICALVGIVWWFRLGRPRIPWREIKDAVVEVMQSTRQGPGPIALPPDNDGDLEAQRQAVVDETAVPAENQSHRDDEPNQRK